MGLDNPLTTSPSLTLTSHPHHSQFMESEPGISVSRTPSLRQLNHIWLWPSMRAYMLSQGGDLGSCPPGNGGGSPLHKESSSKAIWGDPYVSPTTTVSMENGLGPAPGSPEKQPSSPSPPSVPETGQGTTKGEGGTPAPASLPGGSKEEEEKAKRLLYCALCKVAVNSLSQLEAHNKGMDSFTPTPTPLSSAHFCSLHPNSPIFQYPSSL